MLTAAGTVDDRIDGLTLGADDYLGKPFAFGELVARIRALARRSRDPLPPVLERHDVRLDPARREATRAGHFLHLTRKEFGVLEALLAADGAVVSAEDLLERVWDEHADRALLERLVANLVENAVRHNVPGGWVEVGSGLTGLAHYRDVQPDRLQGSRGLGNAQAPLADGRAVIRVANGGRPIPPEQVAALFEPFRRLDGDRTGSGRSAGLGLSILRSVAAAHGGRAGARALDGGGLEVTVELPRAPR